MMGQYYLYCMVLTNLLSLFIYNVFVKWFFPHTLTVIILVDLGIGIYLSRKRKYEHWLKIQIGCTLFSNISRCHNDGDFFPGKFVNCII